MPRIAVDWSKPLDGMFAAFLLPQELRCEGGVVLHASKLVQLGTVGGSLPLAAAAVTAIALAEVNTIDATTPLLNVKGKDAGAPDRDGLVRVQAHATRLHLRHGEPVDILHPFSEVEPLFRAYRAGPVFHTSRSSRLE